MAHALVVGGVKEELGALDDAAEVRLKVGCRRDAPLVDALEQTRQLHRRPHLRRPQHHGRGHHCRECAYGGVVSGVLS
eukprot:7287250-Prymnesium_polylepis.1